MAKTRNIPWKQESSGQYSRQVGRKAGKSGQAKFRLGANLQQAQLAAQKLAMLWDIVVEQQKRLLLRGNFAPPSKSPDDRSEWTEEVLRLLPR